ncbi:MAG: FtsX-like permease family protein, partial [Actinomycetota bacterium]|nr:FtsX-like permease family protein [Actinomycetota bacterium]
VADRILSDKKCSAPPSIRPVRDPIKASRRFVSRMVVAEAAGVALIGSLTGLILGGALHFLSDKILSATTSIDIQYSPRPTTLIFVAVACGLCIVGALIPAMRASRMNISESILNE